jgi:hypothetical protein
MHKHMHEVYYLAVRRISGLSSDMCVPELSATYYYDDNYSSYGLLPFATQKVALLNGAGTVQHSIVVSAANRMFIKFLGGKKPIASHVYICNIQYLYLFTSQCLSVILNTAVSKSIMLL